MALASSDDRELAWKITLSVCVDWADAEIIQFSLSLAAVLY